jgi:phage shock protein A
VTIMPLFRRIADIVSANLNEMVERFEDPETMLRQAIREMEQAVSLALDRAVAVVANEKLLTRRIEEQRRQSERWQQRAVQAVERGEDDLARRALSQRMELDGLIESLETQQTGAADLSRKLRRQIEAMRIKLAEAKRRLAAVTARKRVAEARKRLALASPDLSRFDSVSNFDRWMERMELAEAEAEAWCELSGTDDETGIPEQDDVQLEQELAALKAGISDPSAHGDA